MLCRLLISIEPENEACSQLAAAVLPSPLSARQISSSPAPHRALSLVCLQLQA